MVSVHDFGAKGDGKTDDTSAIQHAVEVGGGEIVFPKGTYLLTRPIRIHLAKTGTHGFRGEGGTANLVMKGPGPAIHCLGSHQKTALPADITKSVWQKERMVLFSDLEIVGEHPEADGIALEGCVQPTLRTVLIRNCRHGLHLKVRNRNVLVSECHIYDNSGVGIFMDRVNLHQVNITGCHISYCKRGGVVIAESEIRNIQIVGNDIEYNFDPLAKESADILFDCRAGTVREGTIVGNTIQAKGSPGGANIRLLGKGGGNPNAVGLLAITGNLVGSQETVLHLQSCRGVSITGNSIYSGYHHAILAEDSGHLVIGSNSIDHNPEYPGPSTDALQFNRCNRVQLTGLVVQHTRPAGVAANASLEFMGCTHVQVSSCQIHNPRGRGIMFKECQTARVAGSMIVAGNNQRDFLCSIEVHSSCNNLAVTGNFLSMGTTGDCLLPAKCGIASGNLPAG